MEFKELYNSVNNELIRVQTEIKGLENYKQFLEKLLEMIPKRYKEDK